MDEVTYYSRSAWTSVQRPASKLTPIDPAELVGIAVHYTGSASPLGLAPSLAQSKARLEAERVEHVQGRGWSDIAYGTAIDQAGRVFDCRGIDWRSAANGDQHVNRTHGSITILLGVGDQPTGAALAAFGTWYWQVWLKRWPHATQVVGHRDLHQTECPGAPLYDLIKAGKLAGPPPGKDPDPMAGFTLDELGKAVAKHTMSAASDYKPHDPTVAEPERLIAPVEAIGETLRLARANAASLARIEAALGKVPGLLDGK